MSLISLQYGLNSIPAFAEVGGVYLNFGLWGLALLPGWLVVRQIGVALEGGTKQKREGLDAREIEEPESGKSDI